LSIYLLSSTANAALYGVGLGFGGSANANTRTTITYNTGVAGTLESSLAVTASADTTVYLDFYLNANIQASLPAGVTGGGGIFTSITSALTAGFTLSASGGATLTTPTLTTPELDATFAAGITGNVNACVLKLDTTTNTYERIKVDSYNVNSRKITVTLPGAGTYVIVKINEVLSVSYATPTPVFAAANRTYSFSSDFAIKFSSTTPNNITVTTSSKTTKPSNITLGVSLGVFFQISLLTPASHQSELRYTYTQAQLTQIGLSDAARLKFAYYSDAEAKWVVPPGTSSVDATNKVVIQSTTTFSEWGIYYQNSGASLRASLWVVFSAIVLPILSKYL
jgi:hypothetical protein